MIRLNFLFERFAIISLVLFAPYKTPASCFGLHSHQTAQDLTSECVFSPTLMHALLFFITLMTNRIGENRRGLAIYFKYDPFGAQVPSWR